MEQAAGTEVKNIKPWAWWGGIDPFPPTAQKPREENGYWVVPGIRMEGWHRYKFEELDRVMNAAKMYNLSVALAIHGPPKWPRGDDVCEYDFGTYHPCGVIKQSHFEIFRPNFARCRPLLGQSQIHQRPKLPSRKQNPRLTYYRVCK